jgi:hypothetical protein
MVPAGSEMPRRSLAQAFGRYNVAADYDGTPGAALVGRIS